MSQRLTSRLQIPHSYVPFQGAVASSWQPVSGRIILASAMIMLLALVASAEAQAVNAHYVRGQDARVTLSPTSVRAISSCMPSRVSLTRRAQHSSGRRRGQLWPWLRQRARQRQRQPRCLLERRGSRRVRRLRQQRLPHLDVRAPQIGLSSSRCPLARFVSRDVAGPTPPPGRRLRSP